MKLYDTCQSCHAELTEGTQIQRFFGICNACSEKARKEREKANAHKIRITKEDFEHSTWIGAGSSDSTSKITKHLADGDTLVLFFRRSYESGEIIHDSIYAKILDKYTIERDLDSKEHLLLPWQY